MQWNIEYGQIYQNILQLSAYNIKLNEDLTILHNFQQLSVDYYYEYKFCTF